MVTNFTLTPEAIVTGQIYATALPGLFYLNHSIHGDDRGFFAEIAILDDLNSKLQQPFIIRQINVAHSALNVCRGFHAESWNKLITVTRGSVFCAVADIRKNSSTYGQVVTFNLGDQPSDLHGTLFIQSGLGNSYCVVEGPCDYCYAVDSLYRDRDSSADQAISLFDPQLNVTWPIPQTEMILSQRDLNAKHLN